MSLPTSLAKHLGLVTGRNHVLPDSIVRRKLYTRLVRDPIAPVLIHDSLDLSPAQAAQLKALDTAFVRAADSVLGLVAAYVQRMGDRLSDPGLSTQLNSSLRTLSQVTLQFRARTEAFLTVEQRWRLAH
jgi:hypothetical protein